MKKNYERLVELFVKSDLRDEIKGLKREKTYDEFLRNLIRKEKGEKAHPPNSKLKATKLGAYQ